MAVGLPGLGVRADSGARGGRRRGQQLVRRVRRGLGVGALDGEQAGGVAGGDRAAVVEVGGDGTGALESAAGQGDVESAQR